MPLATHKDENDKPVPFIGAFAFHAGLVFFTVVPAAIVFWLLLLIVN